MQFTCTQAFQAHGRIVTIGQVLDADDPIITGREHLFTATGEPDAVKRPRSRIRAAVAGPVADPPEVG